MIKPQHLRTQLPPSLRSLRTRCGECHEYGQVGGIDTKRRLPICRRCVVEAVELHALMRGLLMRKSR